MGGVDARYSTPGTILPDLKLYPLIANDFPGPFEPYPTMEGKGEIKQRLLIRRRGRPFRGGIINPLNNLGLGYNAVSSASSGSDDGLITPTFRLAEGGRNQVASSSA